MRGPGVRARKRRHMEGGAGPLGRAGLMGAPWSFPRAARPAAPPAVLPGGRVKGALGRQGIGIIRFFFWMLVGAWTPPH
jgi:hypothetical protein